MENMGEYKTCENEVKYNKEISYDSNNQFYKVYDKDGRFLGNLNIKDEKSLTSEYLHGVTCFVVNENKEVLMEVRANTELTPGKIDLVSGHVNGNESGGKAIIRELNEEVGIKNVSLNQLHKLTYAAKPLGFESKGKIKNFFIDFYCLLTKKENVTSMQKEEVKDLKWVPLEDALKLIELGKTKFPKQGEGVNYGLIFYNVRSICQNMDLDDSMER